MSVGVIKGRAPISGSCGGISSLEGGSVCQFCENKGSCIRDRG
ncbi:MAG: hypothetical protein CMQ40_12670 [Gammaproteobacteria bacterium]|nr:hypothetical protein [Gammaproteobacteria bacterium]